MAAEWVAGFTKAELARAFGVKVAAVGKWVEEGCPREKVGRRVIFGIDSIRWIIENRHSKNGRPKKRDPRDDKARLEVEKLQVELDKARGELVPIVEFDRTLEEILRRLDARISSLPRKWAPDLLAVEEIPEMVQLLDKRIDELRAELKRLDERRGD